MTTEPISILSDTSVSQNREESSLRISTEVDEFLDFLRLIDALPDEFRPDFYRSLDRLVDGYDRRQRILGHIQDSLSQMKVDLKYLLFDLEATRRERDDYRRQLERLTWDD